VSTRMRQLPAMWSRPMAWMAVILTLPAKGSARSLKCERKRPAGRAATLRRRWRRVMDGIGVSLVTDARVCSAASHHRGWSEGLAFQGGGSGKMEGMTADERFMRQAIELATTNVTSGAGGPFGAVIVRDGAVVATGVNKVTATNDPTAHAEVTAIRNACAELGTFELNGCTIYSSCEPCPMCLAAILWARCERLVYGSTAGDAAEGGFDDSKFYEQVRLGPGERELPCENLLRDEARVSFDCWRAQVDRIVY
jgi:guanine deaminase